MRRSSGRRLTSRALDAALAATLAAPPARAAGDRRPAPAGPSVVRLPGDGAEIPVIRTARGLTTMITLPEEAREAVCGDLYDPQANAGGFVIQRSGRDLFVKPLRAASGSNLFVKTDRATFAFDLVVVEPARAMRVVYVGEAAPERALAAEAARLARVRAELEAGRAAARAAFERERAEADRAAAARAEALARELVVTAVAADAGVSAVTRPRWRSGAVAAEFGPAAIRAGRETFVRCTLTNAGAAHVTVASAESTAGGRAFRSAVDARLAPRGSVTVVLAFDAPLAPGSTISFLDAAGAPVLVARPFH